MIPSLHTPRPTRTVNPTAALAGAEDDFREECFAFYDHPRPDGDLIELEALAKLTADFARNAGFIIGRMEYAAGETKHGLLAYLLDVIDDQLDHGVGSVVRAHVARMESEK